MRVRVRVRRCRMAVSVAVRWGRHSTPPQGCDEGVSRRGRRVGRCPVISHQRRRGGTPCRGDCAARHHRAPQDRMTDGEEGEGEGKGKGKGKGRGRTFHQPPPPPRPRASGGLLPAVWKRDPLSFSPIATDRVDLSASELWIIKRETPSLGAFATYFVSKPQTPFLDSLLTRSSVPPLFQPIHALTQGRFSPHPHTHGGHASCA